MKFPKDFYWGAATASYQVEGWNENTDWALAAKQGKVPTAGRLADHYNRFKEDFDIAKKLGHNAHRFSVEWARIEPREGEFDKDAILHYREVLTELNKRGITPFITLWHFTLPLWFAEKGGFEHKDSPEIFARYCSYVVKELGDLCDHFATINEPNVFAGHGWIYGAWPPFKRGKLFFKPLGKDDGSTRRVGAVPKMANVLLYFRVEKNLIKAHIQAFESIKKVRKKAKVSIVKHVRWFTSDGRFVNRIKAGVMQYLQSDRYMSRIKDHLDEIGLNYYRHTRFGDNLNYLTTDMDWDVYPSGICGALMTLKKFKMPIFISEAGLADATDQLRAQYLQVQIKSMMKAMEKGVDVRGHMYWSLIDNYEWALGIDKKFGLVEIDYHTLERKIRPSAWVYKEIIEEHST